MILIAGSIILLYSVANFELAEQHFEAQRNGLECNKPGSGCPYPDFSDPMIYGMIGLAIFSVGAVLSILKEKSTLTKLIFGITSWTSGISSLVFSFLSYVDDYNHFELMMKHCTTSSCMYPNVFANIQPIQFFGIYGAILLGLGIFRLVIYFRGINKK